jgi:hypothetical protein
MTTLCHYFGFTIADMVGRDRIDSLFEWIDSTRVPLETFRTIIHEYPNTFVSPPLEWTKHLRPLQVRTAILPTWFVRIPLWSLQEGRSDLVVDIEITFQSEGPRLHLLDILVP